MPEMPEVETIKRIIEPQIVGVKNRFRDNQPFTSHCLS